MRFLKKLFNLSFGDIKVSLHRAARNDIPFIFETFLECAKDGHFSLHYKPDVPYEHRGFKVQNDRAIPCLEIFGEPSLHDKEKLNNLNFFCITLEQIITHGNQRRHHFERGNEELRTDLFVVVARKKRIGFATVTEKYPHSYDSMVEFEMAGIKKKFQNRKLGSKMLDELIEMYSSKEEIYARCLDVSEKMFGMLKKRGFNHINTIVNMRELQRFNNNGI